MTAGVPTFVAAQAVERLGIWDKLVDFGGRTAQVAFEIAFSNTF